VPPSAIVVDAGVAGTPAGERGHARGIAHRRGAMGVGKQQTAPRIYLQVLKPVTVGEGDKKASLFPADRFAVTYEISYEHPVIKNQRFDVVVTPESFQSELAPARTFGFLADLTMMREAGLANGGSLENAIVIGNYSVLNDGGLRFPDEFVRHKAMDAVGDLYLAGHQILGRLHAYKSGHGLNHKLVTRLLEDKKAYRFVEGRPTKQASMAPEMPYRQAHATY